MPTLSTPQQIVREITTKTENGEVTINLNLCLTLKLDGKDIKLDGIRHTETVEQDRFSMEIPDIDVSPDEMISFGKDVK